MGRRRALEARDALLAANSRWTFRKSARFMDRVDVRARVERWGNSSSFEVRYEGTIGGEACFEGAVTYVATEVDVRTGERKPVPVPEDIRRALGGTRARLLYYYWYEYKLRMNESNGSAIAQALEHGFVSVSRPLVEGHVPISSTLRALDDG